MNGTRASLPVCSFPCRVNLVDAVVYGNVGGVDQNDGVGVNAATHHDSDDSAVLEPMQLTVDSRSPAKVAQ